MMHFANTHGSSTTTDILPQQQTHMHKKCLSAEHISLNKTAFYIGTYTTVKNKEIANDKNHHSDH